MNVRFRRWICAGILAGLIAGFLAMRSATAEQLQLVIAASSSSPAGIAEKAKQLSAQFKNGLVIQTSECGDEHNVYAFVSGIEDSRAAAQSALAVNAGIHPRCLHQGVHVESRIRCSRSGYQPSTARLPMFPPAR